MNEFMNLMTIKTAAIGEVNDMFKTFDVDKNGFIDWNELKVGMQNLVGHELEDSDIDEMMEEADLDGDGRINYAGIDWWYRLFVSINNIDWWYQLMVSNYGIDWLSFPLLNRKSNELKRLTGITCSAWPANSSSF